MNEVLERNGYVPRSYYDRDSDLRSAIDLLGVDEVGDGEMKMAWVDGTDQVLVINAGGEYTAVQGICSHEYFELDKGFLTSGTLTWTRIASNSAVLFAKCQ